MRKFFPEDVVLAFVVAIIVCSPFVLVSAAETPLQVVQRVRAKYPTLPGNRPITNQALREIASDPAVAGGIYVKTTGNNCLGYSCDLICYKDGRFYDVFVAWDNLATPSWNLSPSKADPSRCTLQTVGTPVPPTPPVNCDTCQLALATCRSENEQLKKEKAGLVIENKRLFDHAQEWDARLNKCLTDYDALLQKYNSVKCVTPSYLGWHSPCTVVKP